MSSPTFERINHRLSPASLNAYFRCPRKFQWRYIRKVKTPYVFKPHLAFGGATHKAIARCLGDQLDQQPQQTFESYATTYVGRERYPDDGGAALRAEHIPQVVEHMDRGLGALPTGYRVHSVEREYRYRIALPDLDDAILLTSKVDLVIEHGDDLVDHVDFKTGSQQGDPFQNLLSRITVKHAFDARRKLDGLPELDSAKLRTINLLTRDGTYLVYPADRNAHAATWQSIRQTISEIGRDTEWRPRPDPPVCRFCEFAPNCDAAELGEDE
jgi:hypothetical protein